MCVIIDASVAFEVFGRKRTPAGTRFRDWLDDGRGQLVVGGRALEELARNRSFVRWLLEARRMSGRVRQIGGARIRQRQDELVRLRVLQSDDEHVVALALVSGARLLYTDDARLQRDFVNPAVVDPAGGVYTSRPDGHFTAEHRALLDAKELCVRPESR